MRTHSSNYKGEWFISMGLNHFLTLLHSARSKLFTILAFLSAIELKGNKFCDSDFAFMDNIDIERCHSRVVRVTQF